VPISQSPDFGNWAISRWLNEMNENFMKFVSVIELIEKIRKVQRDKQDLKQSSRLLLSRVFSRTLGTHPDVPPASRFRIASEKIIAATLTDPDFVLWGHISLLDSLRLEDDYLEPLCDEFFNHMVSTVNSRVSNWYRHNLGIVHYLLPLLPRIKLLFLMRTGSRLKEILDIFKAVDIFDGTLPQSQWQEIFEWVMEQIDNRYLFGSFAIWGRYIKVNESLRMMLKPRMCERLDRLVRGFCDILRPNHQLRAEFEGFVKS
jgi:hypothetical protein